MTEMIERVARALQALAVENGADPWESCPEPWREVRRRDARAAIEAMREPTLAMVNAACRVDLLPPDDSSNMHLRRDEVGEIYDAMIDAALTQNSPT